MKKLLVICGSVLVALILLLAHFESSVQAQVTTNSQYKYISTATTTPVRDGPGFLNTVIVNGGTAGAVTLYDIASASCTGTPAAGSKFAVIEAIAATNPTALPYNLRVTNGLCVLTAAATDLTVTFN